MCVDVRHHGALRGMCVFACDADTHVCVCVCVCVLVCLCVYVCVYLEGLDEGPQQDPDGVALSQQLDEPSRPEQSQEAQVQQPILRGSTTHCHEREGERERETHQNTVE